MSTGTGNPSGESIGYGDSPGFLGAMQQQGMSLNTLLRMVNDSTVSANAKLEHMRQQRSTVSIPEMLSMQMLMNNLSQMSEMATSIVSASNTAIMSQARGIKG